MPLVYECFEVSQENAVARLRLNRPQKANSLARSFWAEFPQAIDALSRSGEVRALVIEAEGDVFCGGLDLQMFSAAQEFHAKTPQAREAMIASLLKMQDAFNALERARFPVIAAVQGACIGAGVHLISACDFCFVSEQAKFRIEETNIGMMADLGVLQRLPHCLPSGVARYLALTGDTLSAGEAYRLGLAVKVFSDAEQLQQGALAAAQRIAERAPLAVSNVKRSLIYGRDHSVYEGLQHTAMLQGAILSGDDILQALQARMAGKAADFENLPTLPETF